MKAKLFRPVVAGLVLAFLGLTAQAQNPVYPTKTIPGNILSWGRYFSSLGVPLTDSQGNFQYGPIATDGNGDIYCANCTGTAGAPILTSPANSSSGTDDSANAPAALTTLATLTVATPGAYRVQNQSAATIQVIMDNGTSGPTIFLLAPGAGANQQGADTSPELPWFVGRIIIAGPSGSQFAARSN